MKRILFLVLFSVLTALPSVVAAQTSVETAPHDVWRIVVISDLNERYGDQFHRDTVHAAISRIVSEAPDIVLVTGDMVAGQRPGLDYAGMWQAFHQAVTIPLEGIPLAVAPGNHDASSGSRFEDERTVYQHQWQVLRPDAHESVVMIDDADYPRRYSFIAGSVFFVALDATARDAFRQGDQLDWLEEQLKTEAAAVSRARILFGHFPLYPVAQGRERDFLLSDEAVRLRVENLLREYDVDLFVSGHHHAYYPGRHPTLPVRLLAVGCLGGGPRSIIGDSRVIEDIDDPTERSFVIIEVSTQGITSIEAYRGPDFTAVVPRSHVPERIGAEAHPVVRDDIEP